MVVSFDLFGTLIDVRTPSEPATAVATELSARGVSVPADWPIAYRESHTDAPVGAEVSLFEHVIRALQSRGIEPSVDTVHQAVTATFVPTVTTRTGACEAIESAGRGVGICSNCSVPGLVSRALGRSDIERDAFDAIVTSVACGWRKPDHRAFETISSRLGASTSTLIHVGDDPSTDGGIEAAGGTFIDVNETPLTALPARLEDR